MSEITFPTDENEAPVIDNSIMQVPVDEEEVLEEELIIEDFTIDGICGVY